MVKRWFYCNNSVAKPPANKSSDMTTGAGAKHVFATRTHVCHVFTACLPCVSSSGPHHMLAKCLQRVCHVFSPSGSMCMFTACLPHVRHVFATCLLQVYHLFSTSGSHCVSATCLQHIVRMFATCFPLLAHAVCSPRVCNVFATFFPFRAVRSVLCVFAACLQCV